MKLGFPSMKNSRLSHVNTGLLIPINPCILGSFLVVGLKYTFIVNTAVLLEDDTRLTFSGTSN